jgi:fructokinase
VVGENLVDLLVAPDGSVDAVVGGGPLNVARTIGRLGGDVHFVSGVSNDAFGTFVRDALEDSDVRLALPRGLDRPTTLAVVELDPAGPRYHFHLDATAAFNPDPTETSAALGALGVVSALYVGTLGLLVEPMASLGERLVLEAPASTLVAVDPNCRPSAVRDAAAFRSRLARVCARADLVKVSSEDLAYLHPDLATMDAARVIVDEGARCVVVTDGAGPVRALGADIDLTLEVPPVVVVDTVGAGDALVGGLLRWWTGHDLSPAPLGDAASLAAGLAAAIEISRLTCQRAGAQPPRREDVRALEGWRWL